MPQSSHWKFVNCGWTYSSAYADSLRSPLARLAAGCLHTAISLSPASSDLVGVAEVLHSHCPDNWSARSSCRRGDPARIRRYSRQFPGNRERAVSRRRMGLAGLCKEFPQWAKNNPDVSFFRVRAEHVHKASAVRLTPPFGNCCRLFSLPSGTEDMDRPGAVGAQAGREVFPGSVSERLGEKVREPIGPAAARRPVPCVERFGRSESNALKAQQHSARSVGSGHVSCRVSRFVAESHGHAVTRGIQEGVTTLSRNRRVMRVSVPESP